MVIFTMWSITPSSSASRGMLKVNMDRIFSDSLLLLDLGLRALATSSARAGHSGWYWVPNCSARGRRRRVRMRTVVSKRPVKVAHSLAVFPFTASTACRSAPGDSREHHHDVPP